MAAKRMSAEVRDRIRRMKWWHEARFGMFIHWGMSSVLGRNEWVMDDEGLSYEEYEAHAKKFKPKPNAPRIWTRLAKRAGMKYIYMTAKHHDGFCMFDTKTTNYSAAKQGPGRDLVREFVNAARADGLRIGFYYSPMDWHHPDGVKCARDPAALKRYRSYVHEQLRELFTNYGRIDVLWYDGAGPIDGEQWQIRKMNRIIRRLQPGILINQRMFLPEDYDGLEATLGYSGMDQAPKDGRGWETSTTLNEHWGYHKNDKEWKPARTIIRQLVSACHGGGNYTVNLGPRPAGTLHAAEDRILTEVGQWMDRNGEAIYGSEPCAWWGAIDVLFTVKGRTVYAHVFTWPGEEFGISALNRKVLSASFLCNGKRIRFDQDRIRLRFHDLPKKPPDNPVTTIKLELDARPAEQRDREYTRQFKPRGPVWVE